MRRHLILVIVAGVVAVLAAGTAWTQCLETVAKLPHVPYGYATAVAASGNFAYYNSGPVLYVVDVSTPSSPQLLGEVTLRGDIEGIAVVGSIAYVAMDSAPGVCTVDVSDASAPTEDYCVPGWGRPSDVTVSAGYLYVADRYRGLKVFDLEDPAHPVQVGLYDTPGRAWGVSVARAGSCTYAFVADMQAGLRVIDVSTPSAPVEVAHADANMWPEFVSDVAVPGGYAFVADSWEVLRVLDVSIPSTPVETGPCDGCGPTVYVPTSVVVSGSTAYVAGSAVVAVDVSVPSAPEVITTNGGWGFAHDMAVAGGYVFVAHGEDGLSILRACDGAPADFGFIETECTRQSRYSPLSSE